MDQTDKHKSHYGILCGIAAYGSWGIIPLYFKTVASVPPVEVLAHRALWSFVTLVILTGLLGRWKGLWQINVSPRIAWSNQALVTGR